MSSVEDKRVEGLANEFTLIGDIKYGLYDRK